MLAHGGFYWCWVVVSVTGEATIRKNLSKRIATRCLRLSGRQRRLSLTTKPANHMPEAVEPEPISVDLELIPPGDDPIITDPEQELVGVSSELFLLALSIFQDDGTP